MNFNCNHRDTEARSSTEKHFLCASVVAFLQLT